MYPETRAINHKGASLEWREGTSCEVLAGFRVIDRHGSTYFETRVGLVALQRFMDLSKYQPSDSLVDWFDQVAPVTLTDYLAGVSA